MNEFTSDLWVNMNTYYDDFIAVLPKLGLAIIVFMIFLGLASLISRLMKTKLGPRMDDPLLVQFLSNLSRIIIILISLLIVLKIIGLGSIATSIMAGAGVGAFVIGFAFKDIGENFLAGIMMAFNRPFRLHDTVELNGVKGKVIALNLRDTQIKTFDGKDVFIPNGAILKNSVVNHTVDGFIRTDFMVGLDYESDIQKAIQIIDDTLMGIEVLEKEDRKPFAAIEALATSTVNIRVYYWMDTFHPKMPGTQLKNLVFTKVLEALVKGGFYMPADIVELKNYQENVFKLGNSAT